MDLVQEYFTLANEVIAHRETVYDGATANQHNQKVYRMEAIAREIEALFPELKDDFSGLLSNEHPDIRLWAAHHLLEHMSCDRSRRKSALMIIRHRARRDHTALGYGEKLWLKDWYRHHPKDRWL